MNGLSWLSHEWVRCLEWIDPVRFYKWSQGPPAPLQCPINGPEMLAKREQLMEDIISIMESHDSRESPDYLSNLCEAVCKNFPEA